MKKTKIVVLLILCSAFFTLAFGQNCSAAFVNDKIVVDEYTTTGKCVLPASTTGLLTVQTAELSPEKSIPTGKLSFQIAIRHEQLNTLRMYSKDTYRQIAIEKVLEKCQKGDHIVLLMLEEGYALPHHEILVQ
ncbi:MAG: hypothetical protein HUU01_02635 [Saprospiraceae bacterium]|nr:hypothetical protein [Saprospiraceae bacterium]